jgi:hypothetical protein
MRDAPSVLAERVLDNVVVEVLCWHQLFLYINLPTEQANNQPIARHPRAKAKQGRRFQLGEGWHSSEHPVHFWNLLPRMPKEADAQCYACTTAYATMIHLCNVF